jgi:regulator of nucleoside diphosphate kinase
LEDIMRLDPIIISDPDIARLRGLLGAGADASQRNAAHLDELRDELDRAIVVAADLVPSDVVTMGSWVQIRDSAGGRVEAFQLVYPREADAATHRVSILAPLGTALLGNSEGDDVEWRMPGGVRRFRVYKVTQDTSPANDSRFTQASAVAASFA